LDKLNHHGWLQFGPFKLLANQIAIDSITSDRSLTL